MNFLKPLSVCLRSTIFSLADVSLIGMLGGLSVCPRAWAWASEMDKWLEIQHSPMIPFSVHLLINKWTIQSLNPGLLLPCLNILCLIHNLLPSLVPLLTWEIHHWGRIFVRRNRKQDNRGLRKECFVLMTQRRPDHYWWQLRLKAWKQSDQCLGSFMITTVVAASDTMSVSKAKHTWIGTWYQQLSVCFFSSQTVSTLSFKEMLGEIRVGMELSLGDLAYAVCHVTLEA